MDPLNGRAANDWMKSIRELDSWPGVTVATLILAPGVTLLLDAFGTQWAPLNLLMASAGIYVYGVFWFFVSLYVAQWVALGFKKTKAHFDAKRHEKQLQERIKNVDQWEAGVLREFLHLNRNTINAPIDNPVVAGLLHDDILYSVGNMQHHLDDGRIVMPVCISSLAKRHIQYHTMARFDCFEKREDGRYVLTKSGLEWIGSTRPEWAAMLERGDWLYEQ